MSNVTFLCKALKPENSNANACVINWKIVEIASQLPL